jgi:hypothetical protein
MLFSPPGIWLTDTKAIVRQTADNWISSTLGTC